MHAEHIYEGELADNQAELDDGLRRQREYEGKKRYARITAGNGTTKEAVAAYLPGNYSVVTEDDGFIYVEGVDNAGWSLDGYVLPRLASGCHFGIEVKP